MENSKRKYWNFKEDISILNKIAKQIDTISEILNTYGVDDMSLREVKDFLEDRFMKIDNETFNKFNDLMAKNKNHESNKQKDELLKLLKEVNK